MVGWSSRDELMDLAQIARALNRGMSWEAIRWRARCVQVDCDQGCEAFACYTAVDEWRLRHTERYGHHVNVEWEWDSTDGRCGGCSEELVTSHFAEGD